MPGSRRRGGTRTRTRSDACPGAWRRHDAADGALARFRPVGGAVSAAELRILAGAALGGGSALEVTSRGSLQVRGLDPRTADDLADAMRRLPAGPDPSRGAPLLDGEGRDVPCTVLASARTPVADAAARFVADALRGREDVPGRLLVALDDSSGDVAAEGADITVVVGGDGEPATLRLDDVDVGLAHPDAGTLALAAIEAFLAVRGDAWRLADLDDGVARVAEHLRRQESRFTGTQRQESRFPDIGAGAPHLGVGDDGVLEVMPRLGELDLATVGVLVDLLDGPGHGAVLRLTPRRTLVLRGLADPHAALGRLAGLVETRAGSPWASLSACVGAPRCAKAHADVRGELTAAVATGHAGGGRVPAHWIGCHRGCGTPGGRVAVVEALPTGGYRTVVRAGRVTR